MIAFISGLTSTNNHPTCQFKYNNVTKINVIIDEHKTRQK